MCVGVIGIIDFVAYAPEEDAGVAAVATHHVGHIAVYPFLEVVVCALEAGCALVPAFQPLALGEFPFVAGFVHDQESERVAEGVEGGQVGIVAHADGVDAQGFQGLQATLPYIGGNSSTEGAGIIVDAYALDLHPLAVEGKAFVGRELQCAQSHRHFGAVDFLSAREQACAYLI